jgi:hypothetical protein
VAWDVEVTDQFVDWYRDILPDRDVEAVEQAVEKIRLGGPALGRPRVDSVRGSRYPKMKELRVQSHGDPIRILFAFDPRRVAILLIGGAKTTDRLFYERIIPLADDLYEQHLREIAED